MVAMKLRISGLKAAHPLGSLIVEANLLTAEAQLWTSGGVLSWAGVRHLDMVLKRIMATQPLGQQYLYDMARSSGMHLFSLLTGMKWNALFPHSTMADPHLAGMAKPLLKAPALDRPGGAGRAAMAFPNEVQHERDSRNFAQLFSLQADSRYHHFCEGQLIATLQRRGPLSNNQINEFSPEARAQFLRSLRNDPDLELQDKKDIYGYFIIQAWHDYNSSNKSPGGPMSVASYDGGLMFMPPGNPGSVPSTWRDGKWFRYIHTTHPVIANFLGVSNWYDRDCYPLV